MPAIGPIDYSTGADSPVKAFDDSLSAATNLQAKGLQNQALAQQLNQNAQLMQDTKLVGANPTPEAIAQLSIKYPQLASNFKQSFDILDSQQQQARLNSAIPIYSAVQSGNTDVAVGLLNKQADAYENAGKSAEAQQARTMAKLVTDHPEVAKTTMGLLLSGAMGPDKFSTTFGTIGKETRENQLQPAAVAKATGEAQQETAKGAVAGTTAALANKNVESTIGERAARLGLDADKAKADTQIKMQELQLKNPNFTPQPEALKVIGDAADKATTSQMYADRLNTFADKLQGLDLPAGQAAKFGERIKEFTGDQNAITQLRQEYARLRSQGVVAAIPKGISRLTNNEINLFANGIPPDTANVQTLTAFARSMAKVEEIDSLMNNAKAEWVQSVGHQGAPKQDIIVDGLQIPQGTSYAKFLPQYLKAKTAEIEKQQLAKEAASKSYMQSIAPAPTSDFVAPGQP